MIFIKNEFIENLNVWNVDNLFQSIFSFIFHSATLENPKLIICYTKKSLFSYICVVKLQYYLHNTFNIYSVFYKASSCFISMTNIHCLKQRVVYNYHIFILVFVLKNQIILFITNQKWSKMRDYSASMEFSRKSSEKIEVLSGSSQNNFSTTRKRITIIFASNCGIIVE